MTRTEPTRNDSRPGAAAPAATPNNARTGAYTTTDEETDMTTTDSTETTPDAIAPTDADTPQNAPAGRAPVDTRPVLELRDVSYRYRPGLPLVLDHVNHAFAPARMHAVIGPSGTGKTTMLSLLSGLAVPTSGTVLYKGRDLSKMDRYAYRASEIGVIFQSFNLMPSMTVSENIAMSMKLAGAWHGRKEARETVLRVLDEVDLPDDYIDRRIGQLSGGEQQRVAIARVLSYSPSVIIADEPTGNLDPESTAIIVDIFRALAEEDGRTVIIVTHSAEVASACDDVFDLSLLKKRTRPRKARRARRPVAATGRA